MESAATFLVYIILYYKAQFILIQNYPKGNAKDNAMYKLAGLYFKQGKIWSSLKLYKDIILNYPNGRMASRAQVFIANVIPGTPYLIISSSNFALKVNCRSNFIEFVTFD